MRLVTLVTLVALSVAGVASRDACAQRPSREFWGFTGPWDPRSAASVHAHSAALDAVVTGWIALDSATARPLLPSPWPDTVKVGDGARRMAIVTSWHGDRFHPRTIRTLARDPRRLAAAASAVARHARAMRYEGIVLDFEALERADRADLLATLRAFADSAHAAGVRTVAAAVPAIDTGAYPTRGVLGAVDLAVVMLYDQHWSTSEPGPIAAPDWVRGALAARVARADPGRFVAALPVYGYWWKGRAPASDVSFADAQRIADSTRTPLARDAASATLRARRGGAWEIWVSDATLLRALVRASAATGVHRFALWRLGLEDPAIWRTVIR